MRIGCLTLKTGNAPGHAARARNDPNVLRVSKRDLCCAHRRSAQQTRTANRLGVHVAEDRIPEPVAHEANSHEANEKDQSPATGPRPQGTMQH